MSKVHFFILKAFQHLGLQPKYTQLAENYNDLSSFSVNINLGVGRDMGKIKPVRKRPPKGKGSLQTKEGRNLTNEILLHSPFDPLSILLILVG